jgi:hypothetical protein
MRGGLLEPQLDRLRQKPKANQQSRWSTAGAPQASESSILMVELIRGGALQSRHDGSARD